MDPVATVLAREFPDREPQTVEPVPRGNRKRTVLVDFADDSVVVQLSPRIEDLRVETTLARAVRERTSVPVPAVLATGTIDEQGYAVVERAGGAGLHDRFVGLPDAEQGAVARSFGRWLAACHEAFAFDGYGPLALNDGNLVATATDWRAWRDAYLAAGLDALPEPLADLRGDIEAVVEAVDLPSSPSSRLFPWDLRPGNALYDDGAGVTAVLDWGEPLAATPALSAAKTEHLVCDWYVKEPEPIRAAFRAGYQTIRSWPAPSRADRLTAVVRSAVDSRGEVTRPGYPERTGEAAVRFHRDQIRSLLP
jgi:aminoglycoside phosphotransferase (APT) family kinase protein